MVATSAPKEESQTKDERIYAQPEFDIKAGQAIQSGDAQALKSFIEQGLDPNAWISGKGAKRNMVCTSVAADQPECLKVLLDAGADLDAANRVSTTQWKSLLELAVMRRCEGVVRVLAAAGHNVNVKTGSNGNSLAHFSAGQGSTEMLPVLAEIGVDFKHRNAEGETPLHAAIFNGRCIVWLATQEPSLLESQTQHGRTPLIDAMRWQKEGAAMALLEFDQDLSLQDSMGKDALWWARSKKMDAAAARIEAIQSAKRAKDVIASISGLARRPQLP